MKSLFHYFLTAFFFLIVISLSAQTSSAIVEYESTDKGILIPRMTSNQWASISNPSEGLMVYDSDAHVFMFFNGSTWQQINQGQIGPKGDKGDTGDTGAAGMNGAVGATGAKGDKGDKGDTGDTGAAGMNGAVGATGAKGDKGDKGDTGDTGAAGMNGTNGTNGTNGQGVPTGGTANQVLSKINGTNYNTQWVTPASGGSPAPKMKFVESNANVTNNFVSYMFVTLEANKTYEIETEFSGMRTAASPSSLSTVMGLSYSQTNGASLEIGGFPVTILPGSSNSQTNFSGGIIGDNNFVRLSSLGSTRGAEFVHQFYVTTTASGNLIFSFKKNPGDTGDSGTMQSGRVKFREVDKI